MMLESTADDKVRSTKTIPKTGSMEHRSLCTPLLVLCVGKCGILDERHKVQRAHRAWLVRSFQADCLN